MRASLRLLMFVALIFAAWPGAAAWSADPGMPVKWSQPPVQVGADDAGNPIYWGWDEPSWRRLSTPVRETQAADDWRCTDSLPVTDIHWWGSYLGWKDKLPPTSPSAFWFGIYRDIPVGPGSPFSLPGSLLWQYATTSYKEAFVGYDVRSPNGGINDSAFQYNVSLPQTEWFTQQGTDSIYWLSIVALYPGSFSHKWGWKTRPHPLQDDAVRKTSSGWRPITGAGGESWDLAFELSSASVIPEPSAMLVLASAMAGLAGLAARRKR